MRSAISPGSRVLSKCNLREFGALTRIVVSASRTREFRVAPFRCSLRGLPQHGTDPANCCGLHRPFFHNQNEGARSMTRLTITAVAASVLLALGACQQQTPADSTTRATPPSSSSTTVVVPTTPPASSSSSTTTTTPGSSSDTSSSSSTTSSPSTPPAASSSSTTSSPSGSTTSSSSSTTPKN